MAPPSVFGILTSVLKSAYLVLLCMLILSALIYKSIHFKQPGTNLAVAQADHGRPVYSRRIETAVTNIPKKT